MARIIALDVGRVRVGVALGRKGGGRSQPLKSFDRAQNRAQDAILKLLKEQDVELIVIGMPLHQDGEFSEQCEDIKQFSKRLEKRTEVPIVYFDEYLSSSQAKELLGASSQPDKLTRKKGVIDAVAASIVLDEYLRSLQ